MLITGETGTGKEVVARAIYVKSKRADMPFVPVNCGALTQNLAESQLFGHKKGAFTGADRDHKGFFEVANGGTVFLDELGELDKNIQVKLLRFLESGEIQRLGDSHPIVVDVRVICATNRDLRQMIADGQFREDLLYRLNMFHVHLPPLRDRRRGHPRTRPPPARPRCEAAGGAVVADLLTPEALQMHVRPTTGRGTSANWPTRWSTPGSSRAASRSARTPAARCSPPADRGGAVAAPIPRRPRVTPLRLVCHARRPCRSRAAAHPPASCRGA